MMILSDGGTTMQTMTVVMLFAGLRQVIAYIDPGTGSLILQLLLGGVAGAWVMIKLFGHRIASMLGFSKKKADEADAE